MLHTSKNMFFIELVWLLFHPFLSDAHQNEHREKHFLHYKFTVLTKADTFPEFSAVGVCDDRWIRHFSNEERVWILTEDWTEAPADPPDHRDWFIHQIRTLSNCTDSQCSELHVLQRIIGCELEKLPDGSVNLTVFDEYGFDGEDLISFNSDTMQWIDKSPKAKETKEEWDSQTGRNQFLKHYLKNCTDWISTFINTKKSRTCSDREAESHWLCIAGVAAAVVAGLGLLCWICLQIQKVQSQNAVESLTSDPNPDTEQAAISLFNYESGVTLLTGI